MSRIIVKQLPKSISEEKLRGLFGSKGTITDLQLKYTPDGKFRQFCFIGYRSEEEAQAAIKYFNNSCVQTSRIKVELCAALGGEDKPQPWSKYSKEKVKKIDGETKAADGNNKDKTKNNEKIKKLDKIIGKHRDDPEFQEFMKAHDKNRALWANDAAEATENNDNDEKNIDGDDDDDETRGEEEKAKDSGVTDNDEDGNDSSDVDDAEADEDSKKLAEKPISDLEYMKSLITKNEDKKKVEKPSKSKKTKDSIDLFTIKIHNVPYNTKRQEVLKFFKPLKPYSVRMPTNVHGFCYVGFKTEKEMSRAMLKSKSFIKGKQVFFSDFTEKNKVSKSKEKGAANDGTAAGSVNPKWVQQEEGLRGEEDISDSGRIFFRNLAYTVTDDDLQKLFEKFGPIAEINLPVDSVTRQIKGFGTVTFVMPEHAVQAFNSLDGMDFHGRLLHLIPGKSKDKEQQDGDENDASLSFKEKKALKQRKAAQQPVGWNTLFLGPNAVADILAKRYETTKEKVLDTSDGGSSAAVRIALGETQIVIEMKRFLEENGVCLKAFDAPTAKRSKTVILCKNLPPDTTAADLSPIFAKFGPIGRLVLPPSGVTALIEYCDPTEAKKAFKKLAFSKFKHVPLYLEWAPEAAFQTSLSGEPLIAKQEDEVVKEEEQSEDLSRKENDVKDQAPAEPVEDDDDAANEPPEPFTTLFLRNLNFTTEQDAVLAHFRHLGPIHTVEIAKKKDPDNPRQKVSLGYGFIQFKRSSAADKALKTMQFTTIDGNQIELKRSDRILKTAATETQRRKVTLTKQTGSKILVRNIPFQAKPKEVRDLFKAFGELRSLRLPMKMTPGESSHRGFGFVDFISKSDAKKAFEALSQSTHLYGRRLVLEWASVDDDDIVELRKRTADQYQAGDRQVKRSKKAVFDSEGHIQQQQEDNFGQQDF